MTIIATRPSSPAIRSIGAGNKIAKEYETSVINETRSKIFNKAFWEMEVERRKKAKEAKT